MNRNKNLVYLLQVIVLLLLAQALGSQVLASALAYKPLNILGALMDEIPHVSLLFLSISMGVLTVAAIYVYVRNLDPYRASRPLGLVFLNVLAPFLFAACEVVAWDYVDAKLFTNYSYIGAPLVALLPPILVLLLEGLLARLSRRWGYKAVERQWRRQAIRMFRWTLALRPRQPEVRRELGLLHEAEDECAEALVLLAPLGPVAASEDEARLRALDHCYRLREDTPRALECLLRLRELGAESSTLDRRILDDYLKLERKAEALELLESGRLKQTVEMLMLRHRLSIELGNMAQAVAQIEQIAAIEGKPYDNAIKLYRELRGHMPENAEIDVNMGLLMIQTVSEDRRREGASLLEKAFVARPQRLHLARRLVEFYTEEKNESKIRQYLKALVEGGDANPDYHIEYAQKLIDEGQYGEAAQVLEKMLTTHPEDLAGRVKLARALFMQDELDQADRQLDRAVELLGEVAEIDPAWQHWRHAIEQRRKEMFVTAMAEQVAEQQEDVQKRLDLLDHMLEMGWIDKALDECDALLDTDLKLAPQIEACLKTGIEKNEKNFLLRDYLSDLYFQQGRLDESLEQFRAMAEQSLHPGKVLIEGARMILGRDPNHADARRELAWTLREEQDWGGVIEALDPLLANTAEVTVEDKALWVEAAFRAGRAEEAARVGLTAIDELLTETGFVLLMVDVLQEVADYDGALAVYQKAREVDPDNERLARIERRVRRRRAEHRLAILRQQQESAGLTAAEHLEKADLHRDLGHQDEAIVHYQYAADDVELYPLATAKMALALCERGMYELADETLDPLELTREMSSEQPELKAMMYQVGRALEKIKYFQSAMKYYKRIFRVDAAYEDVVTRLERMS